MAEQLRDAAGTLHPPAANARIVSLVPSITELLFDLGLGDRVVGRTGFCVHPRPLVRDIPKVGGTKDVKIDALRALAPTHVIVNVDENEASTVDSLRTFVPHIVVTHPNAPDENAALFALLGAVFSAEARATELNRSLQSELQACRARSWHRERVLYVIWREPWMTVAADTYIARTLATVGWDVMTPAGGWSGAARYPLIDDIANACLGVDRVLLSTEPYYFTAFDVAALQATVTTPVMLIDAEMTSWYGSRAIRGLAYLRELRDRSREPPRSR
jgi:ABC-type Fe3+-hydroxamate transport system substrate-binding protein